MSKIDNTVQIIIFGTIFMILLGIVLGLQSLVIKGIKEKNYERGIKDTQINAIGYGMGEYKVNTNGVVEFNWITNKIAPVKAPIMNLDEIIEFKTLNRY